MVDRILRAETIFVCPANSMHSFQTKWELIVHLQTCVELEKSSIKIYRCKNNPLHIFYSQKERDKHY